MAKRIVWTEKADLIFTKILKFYIDRNSSKEYSRKLNKEIRVYLEILAKQPFIGRKVNDDDIHVAIKGHFKIFYQIESDKIVVLLVWDCRQKPESLNLKS